jgi:hypothetical protein
MLAIIPKVKDLKLFLVILSIARPGLCCRQRARDFFQPAFSVSIFGAGFRAIIFEFPIQLAGEMDSVCLLEQGCKPRSFFAFLCRAAIGIHHTRDITAQCRERAYSFRSHGIGTSALPWSPDQSALKSCAAFLRLDFDVTERILL